MTLVTKEMIDEAKTHTPKDSGDDFFVMESALAEAEIDWVADKLCNRYLSIKESDGADASTRSGGMAPAAEGKEPDVVEVKTEMDAGASDSVTNVANSAKVDELAGEGGSSGTNYLK